MVNNDDDDDDDIFRTVSDGFCLSDVVIDMW
jgi:hypothetical protein